MAITINYSPFREQGTDRVYNMYTNLVGGKLDQMGLFDYIFVVPFIVKFLACTLSNVATSANVPKVFRYLAGFLSTIFTLASAPFGLAKTGIYIALGVVGIVALGAAIKRAILRKHVSACTKKVNRLLVKPVAAPGQDPDTVVAQPLKRINKLFDGNLNSYKIRYHNNAIQLVHGPHNDLVATIVKNDANIAILDELLPAVDGNNNNALMNWLNNIATNNFIDGASVRPMIEAYKHDKNVGVGATYIRDLHTLITYAPNTVKNDERVANPAEEVIGEPTADFMKDMAKLPKEIRRIIADEVINTQRTQPTEPLAALTQEQRDEAYGKYLSRQNRQPIRRN